MECKNNNFSNPNDLQSAIEGNKREGRTSSFGPYGGMGPMQHSPLPPSMGGGMHMMGMMGTPPRPMQINGNRPPMHPGEQSVIMASVIMASVIMVSVIMASVIIIMSLSL